MVLYYIDMFKLRDYFRSPPVLVSGKLITKIHATVQKILLTAYSVSYNLVQLLWHSASILLQVHEFENKNVLCTGLCLYFLYHKLESYV